MKRLFSIDIARPLLMIGVVLIHSSLNGDIPADMTASVASRLMRFFSKDLCGGCVPAFFIISGFLFFRSTHTFKESYLKKLKSRCHTLLLPYLLWNLLGACLFLIKASSLGYPGYGILEEGHFSIIRFIGGFWDGIDGFPFDFPMWFIRNLIVMVIFSPLFYIMAKRSWATVIVVVVGFLSEIHVWGFIYFLIGAWFALHDHRLPTKYLAYASVLLTSSIILNLWSDELPQMAGHLCIFSRNIGLTAFVIMLGRLMGRNGIRVSNKIQGLAFFVFAIHGLFCSLVRSSILKHIGSADSLHILTAYILTFLTLILSSTIIFLVMERLMPRLTSILSGTRS